MATKIGFWTPIKYEGQPISLGQNIRECADAYFYLGGKVAIVMPGGIANGSIQAKVQVQQPPQWKTALKVASYFTVILPVLMFVVKVISRAFYPCHEHQQTPPARTQAARALPDRIQKAKTSINEAHAPADRTQETRTFVNEAQTLPDRIQETQTLVNGVLQQGVYTQGEPTVFLDPKLLFESVMLKDQGIELNFAEVTIHGRIEIIPVQKPLRQRFERTQQYIRYAGSPNEALLKIAQDNTPRLISDGDLHYESPIKLVLEHANNRLLQTKEFLGYLLTPSDDGRLTLHTVNKTSLLEILELARSNHVLIDLETVDPITHETLFSKWAGTGDAKLTQALLSFDPSAIRQTEGRKESFFIKAALGGFRAEAKVLLQAMQVQGIQPTQTDRWMQKAFTNDCNFSNEQFLQLSIELRQNMFKVANIYINKEFLQKLRDFGMRQPPAHPEGAALFSYNMDAIDVEETLQAFLGNLRRNGLLLTKEEFAEKDPTQYYHKHDDIGRILGRDYIERVAHRLNIWHVKVPKKIAVIQPKNEHALTLEFTVGRGGAMNVKCPSLQIYAEGIEPIERKATKAEMMGLLDIIETTGFRDFFGHNLFMGKNHNREEGIYFIDTEFDNFSSLPSYDNIECLASLMAQKDHAWLEEELQHRVDLFTSQKEAREHALSQEWAQQKPPFIAYGFADRRKPFAFNIADLVTEEVREGAANE